MRSLDLKACFGLNQEQLVLAKHKTAALQSAAVFMKEVFYFLIRVLL